MPVQRFQRLALQSRGKDMHTRRQELRQPRQPQRPADIFELIEAIEHQHDRPRRLAASLNQ